MTTHHQHKEFPVTLGVYWPFYLLAEVGETQGPLGDLITPGTPDRIRALFTPILERTNPTAAHGLTLTDDAELSVWGRIFNGWHLTGAEDELTFLPAWMTVDGQLMAGCARLLTLALYERFDVFLSALHERGRA